MLTYFDSTAWLVALPVKLVLALDQLNAYGLSKFEFKRQVRCRVDHLQLVGAAACSPGTSLWSAPIHDRAGIGSVPIRLPNRDRIERTTSSDRVAHAWKLLTSPRTA